MEDERIVGMFLLRDEAAIKHTSEKYGERLRGLAFDITGDRMTSEECENDTYLKAWDSIPPYRPVSYLYAFLARITRHVSLDACRSRLRLKRSALIVELSDEMEQCIPSPNDTECQVEGELLGHAVSSFLRTVSEEKRNVFVRRYWYLDGIAAIAARYGIGESKIKTMLLRMRNGLRDYLEKEGYTL